MALVIGQSLSFPLLPIQRYQIRSFQIKSLSLSQIWGCSNMLSWGDCISPPQCIDHQGHLHISCTIASEEFNIVAVQGFLYFISKCHGHCKGNLQHDVTVHGNSIVTGKKSNCLVIVELQKMTKVPHLTVSAVLGKLTNMWLCTYGIGIFIYKWWCGSSSWSQNIQINQGRRQLLGWGEGWV